MCISSHGANYADCHKPYCAPAKNAVYATLKQQLGESKLDIEWNFVKFLVDKDGVAVRRYDSGQSPLTIVRNAYPTSWFVACRAICSLCACVVLPRCSSCHCFTQCSFHCVSHYVLQKSDIMELL